VVGINRGIQYVELVSGTTRKATGGAPGSPYWVLFSPDGETVVSTNHDGTVTLWDAESTSPSKTLRGHWSAVQQPVFSPDGDTLYTASHDGSEGSIGGSRSPTTGRSTQPASTKSRERSARMGGSWQWV
jgi:WD40 repeat protein